MTIIRTNGYVFDAELKTKTPKILRDKHGALFETIASGTEKVSKFFSFRFLIVAVEVSFLTGTEQTNWKERRSRPTT